MWPDDPIAGYIFSLSLAIPQPDLQSSKDTRHNAKQDRHHESDEGQPERMPYGFPMLSPFTKPGHWCWVLCFYI
jgi:hypothetical protein